MSISRLNTAWWCVCSAIAGVLASAVFPLTAAHADLMLYPTRLVVPDTQRSAQVEVINRGDRPETYRVAIVNRRMTEDGEIVSAADPRPGELFADGMLVYTPRQITLQPGQSQTVRVSVRRPAGLSDGEYRSHLQFERVPDPDASTDLESLGKSSNGSVAVVLPTYVGASIPVIVRQGQTGASVSLQDLAIKPAPSADKRLLSFEFHRQGNQSVYGDVVVTFTPAGGKPVEIGRVAGLAVYMPNEVRKTQILVGMPTGGTLKNGRLLLNYSERRDVGGKLIAQADLTIP